MAKPFTEGWFNIHPRFSGGSPAVVNIEDAIRVAREEVREMPKAREGMYGPEFQVVAEKLGMGGIVEWKTKGDAPSIIAYDLLTRTWSLYNPATLSGWYTGIDPKKPRIRVILLYGGLGTGTKATYAIHGDDDRLICN